MMNMRKKTGTENPRTEESRTETPRTENRRSHVLRLLCTAALLALALCAGCGRKKDDKTSNVGDVNNVAGFLFHFDQREETKDLLNYKNKDQLPIRVYWYYPGPNQEEEADESVTESAAESVTESYEESVTESAAESVTESYDESVTEGYEETVTESAEDVPDHAPTGSSEDPELIARIYNALNNVIVVGNTSNNQTSKGYYITFVLPDESECRFDFISEGTIRLSEHNYSIETDGSLWKCFL